MATQLIWLPCPFTMGNRDYWIKFCDFGPFTQAGGAGVVMELNNPDDVSQHNPYLPAWVEAAYAVRLPVFGVYSIDLERYQAKFPDWWEHGKLFPGDPFWSQLVSEWGGVLHKQIHGLIYRFVNRTGQLNDGWIRNCISVILEQGRQYLSSIRPGYLTADKIFCWIDQGIEAKSDLSTILKNEDWCVVDQPGTVPMYQYVKLSYENIFTKLVPDYKPIITHQKDWLISRWACNRFQDANFHYEDGVGEGIVGMAVYHGTVEQLRAKFVPHYAESPEPEQPPMPEPEPVKSPLEKIADHLIAIQAELEGMFEEIYNIEQ